MYYYTFHIGDYRKKTGHLTLLEHGIYKALLDTYFETENPLESDISALMRTHGIRSSEEKEAFDNVLKDFFSLTDDGYWNKGADKRIRKAYKKSAKCRAAAKARWAKLESSKMQDVCGLDADACQTHTQNDANASNNDADGMPPNTHNPIPITQYPIQDIASAEYAESNLPGEPETDPPPKEPPRAKNDQKFPMVQDWTPEPESWAGNSFKAGNIQYTPEALHEFTMHWSGEIKVFTETQWQGKLIASIKHQKAKAPPPKAVFDQQPKSSRERLGDRSWAAGVVDGIEPAGFDDE